MQIESVALNKIIPYIRNPRKNENAIEKVASSIHEFGFRQPIVVDSKNVIIAGHTRFEAAKRLGLDVVPVHVADGLTEQQAKAYRIADNRVGQDVEWDFDLLKLELEELDNPELTGFDEDELNGILAEIGEGLTDPDYVPEVPEVPITETGDLWELGVHRLLCGDATKAEDVERLMDGKIVGLLHADPPYGMGKEKDGVVNDNLYRDKLDAFQMDWWRACRPHLEDNASAYIWGNAPDLWRLWYVGGLADSERLTVRNEIAWDKAVEGENPTMMVTGVPLEARRMYHPTERCLFFMLGEQGFNNNADNYWEGWEPIRLWLLGERTKCGWDIPTMKTIAGHSDKSRDHWTGKSQWNFLTRETYEKFQEAAKGDAFKREYDDLKREYDDLKREHDELKQEFYATRAYFDNTHDNMTDVWQFSRVSGEERHGHATPKPVAMMGRCIKSSTPIDGSVLEPFLGSGSTLIACQKTGRKCYGMEIDQHYCDVIITRWSDFTGKDNLLLNGKPFKWSERKIKKAA